MRPLALTLLLAAPAFGGDAATAFRDNVAPVLAAHCNKCHGGEKPKAKLDLSGPRTLDQLRADGLHWFRLLERVEAGTMPPEGSKPLSAPEKEAVATWVRGELAGLLAAQQQQDGRSRLRRLSRTEYANTIQDLFGIRPPVVRVLPADGRVDGYDRVSGAVPFSAAGTAGHLKLAEDMIAQVLAPPPKPPGRTSRLWAAASEQSAGHILELPDDWKVSFNTDTTSGPLRRETPDGKRNGSSGTRVPGVHKLRLRVYAYQTDQPLAFGIYAGHTSAYPQLIELVKVLEAPPGKPTEIETEVYLRTGRDSDLPVSDGLRLIPFGIGVQVPKNTQAANCKGPGLAVQWVDVEEPEWPPPGAKFLLADLPPEFRDSFFRPGATLKNAKLPRAELLDAMRATVKRVGGRLFRRDLTDAEVAASVDRLAARFDAGDQLAAAFRDELAGLLTAPDFLCVMEQPGKLTDFALASRLASFLWNSTPDDELLALARTGKLTDDGVLRAQTERMLADPKAARFASDFADQWLGLWGLDLTTPDRDLYPEYDELLKVSAALETRASFRRVLDKNLGVREFVAPESALVNGPLAKLYGLPGVAGVELREVKLPADSPFGGLWTQAAVMKVTANGTLTSPVKRGVWVAERLLGVPIPPPPPGVEPVTPDTRGAKTLREQLALHAGEGSCKACHARFDPYGFALESFDVTGRFRTKYRELDPDFGKRGKGPRWRDGLPVDPAGTTPAGTAFADVRGLRKHLAEHPEQLARGVTRHLLTYATGEPATPLDQPAIDAVVRSAAADGYGLRSLVHGVVQSEVFRSK